MKKIDESLAVLIGVALFLAPLLAVKSFAQTPTSSPSTPVRPSSAPTFDKVNPVDQPSTPNSNITPQPSNTKPIRLLPSAPSGTQLPTASCGTLTWGDKINTGSLNFGACK